MECFFGKINKKNCLNFLRCEGIYQLTLKLGGNKRFAHQYAKYILRLTILHKLRDKCRDFNSHGIISSFKKKILRVIYYIYSNIFKDVFNLEASLTKVELEIELMEKKEELSDPMVYFKKVGSAYGLIFKNAARGNTLNQATKEKLASFGTLMGTLVALRDSIIDLEEDIKKGNFNPFKAWNKQEIQAFSEAQVKKITYEVEMLTSSPIETTSKIKGKEPLPLIFASIISPVILTLPIKSPASLMQGDCRTQCCTYMCESSSCCIFTWGNDMCPPPIPFIILSVFIITNLIGLCVYLNREGHGCDCSGCDCSGCDCDCGGCY